MRDKHRTWGLKARGTRTGPSLLSAFLQFCPPALLHQGVLFPLSGRAENRLGLQPFVLNPPPIIVFPFQLTACFEYIIKCEPQIRGRLKRPYCFHLTEGETEAQRMCFSSKTYSYQVDRMGT